MAETPPTPPADAEELTPAEEKKFSKFLGKFLADDDAAHPPTQPPATPPSQPAPSQGGSIADQINAALDQRETRSKQTETITKLSADVETLKGQIRKPRHWWFRPFSPLSGE